MARRAHDVTELSQAAIKCRTFGHKWDHYTADPVANKGFNVTWICENSCGVFKHFYLTVRGQYSDPRYSYGEAENYQMAKGCKLSQDDRDVMRLEAHKDLLEGVKPVKAVKKVSAAK